jgi:predicted nucleic acid-binding Zn ribbon protein
MSFIQSTVECTKCGKQMNVAFGIVGMTMIADGGPKDCPDCHGELKRIASGWVAKTK